MTARLRDTLAWTLAVEGAGVLAGLLTLRLAATHFGAEGFGEYTVARRLVAVAAFPLLLGLGIGLPRALARAGAEPGSDPRAGAFGIAAGALAALSLLIFSLITLSLRTPLATLAFGTAEARDLIAPTVIAIAGLAAHTLSYSWFRGHTSWITANLLQLCSIAVVPPTAVALAAGSTAHALTYTGLGWLGTGFIGIGIGAMRIRTTPVEEVRAAGRELLGFGLPRVPGELALFGLLALPAVMVARRDGLVQAGYLSFALSLVQLSAAAVAPVGVLLLPVVSRDAALGRWDAIRGLVRRTLAAGIAVAALLALAIVVGAPTLVSLLLGPDFLAAIPTARWIAPAAVPYAAYLVLRNPLDAVSAHPHNTRNLLLTLLTLWILLGPVGATPGITIVLAFTLLGTLSAFDWRRVLRTASR